ncbi:MAG TPA: DUF547 domain-containing protein [Methyloceanibacter sp.]|nr:DUF547 domain-containing protein [Methyloceanibacter sp.]
MQLRESGVTSPKSSCRNGRLAGLIVAAALAAVSLPEIARADPIQELFDTAASGSAETVDHAVWDRILATYVKPGADGLNRVDYAALKAGGLPPLRAYIESLEQVDPGTLDRDEQFALLANLYNAKTLEIVASHYPVKSIKDISLGGGLVAAVTGGPWKAKVVELKDVPLSLDDIEHGILRPVFKDPRVHYAVNCASIGCPNLRTEAFTGAKLNEQLEQAAKDYVNSPRGVRFDEDSPVVSSIYVWFGDDFGETDEAVLDHLRKYANPELRRRLADVKSIGRDDYDWGLNDAAP